MDLEEYEELREELAESEKREKNFRAAAMRNLETAEWHATNLLAVCKTVEANLSQGAICPEDLALLRNVIAQAEEVYSA